MNPYQMTIQELLQELSDKGVIPVIKDMEAVEEYIKFDTYYTGDLKVYTEVKDTIEVLETKTVLDIHNQDYIFVVNDEGVRGIARSLGGTIRIPGSFDSYFVKEGVVDYTEIWGMPGIIPVNDKTIYRLK